MIGFTYVCLLLVFIIFILYLIKINLKSSPKKIKGFFLVVLGALGIRFIAIMLCMLIEKQWITYSIRHIIFLNLFSIPLLALGCFYIFFRDENKKFDYNYIFLMISSIAFIIFSTYTHVGITIKKYFGFIVSIKEPLIPSIMYMIVLASLSVLTLFFLDKQFSNKIGMRFLLLSLLVTITEFFVFLGGIRIYPYPLIGEAFLLMTTTLALNTFNEK